MSRSRQGHTGTLPESLKSDLEPAKEAAEQKHGILCIDSSSASRTERAKFMLRQECFLSAGP